MRFNKRGETDGDTIATVLALAIVGYLMIWLATLPDHNQCNAYGTEVRREASQVLQNGENDYYVNFVDPETRILTTERYAYIAVVKADVENGAPEYVSSRTDQCMFYNGTVHEGKNTQIHIHKNGRLTPGRSQGKNGRQLSTFE